MEGLWTVEFGSNAGLFGSGVVVMRDGRIEGGDNSYYYVGTYEPTSIVQKYPATLTAKMRVRPFLPNAESVFKTFNRDVTLTLVGTFNDENSAVAVGTPEGMPELNLGVRLTRKVA